MTTYLRSSVWAVVLLAAALTLSACGGAPQPAVPTAHAATGQPGRAVPQLSATATAPPGSVPVMLAVRVNAANAIAFSGNPLSITVLGQDEPGGNWSLARATVHFGDGSSESVTASCAGQGSRVLTVRHVYQAAGRFVVRVTAARFCNPAGEPDLSSAFGYPLVLPSAPAGSSAWPQCSQAELQISARLAGVGVGNRELLFTLRNASTSDCQLYGYPGLRLADPDGLLLPVTVQRGGAYLFPDVSPYLAALPPGGVASFDVGYVAGLAPASSCDWATEAEVFVPESVTYTMVSLAGVGSGDNAVACGGYFRISPVIPGPTGVGFAS